jgi:hypothetical protein
VVLLLHSRLRVQSRILSYLECCLPPARGHAQAFYFIRLIHGVTREPCPGERVWDAGQSVRGSVVRFLRARKQQGYDIYLLPYAEQCNAGYILN